MKNLIIKINDVLCYIVIAIILITSAITFTINPFHAIAFLVVGMVGCSLFFGVWFCLSTMTQESVKQTKLLEKILNKENV